ncbi:transmembrane protein 81-like [Acipenser oxyrinchus oxyrinchus]|uniref:Transmembrane protein 81 n=1 Tax=Acipenser oxyrinchus oxyrinchus TaxID=40147 RepID=A0AAD8CMG2_ACIOX|nr:transmembrane protein 81-like [Acipenser oxyrinchus oxyrinchus]
MSCRSLAWLILASWLFRPAASRQTTTPTFPPELASMTSFVVINSSQCSTTCGIGLRTETLCLLTANARHEGCRKQKVSCVENWVCGMKTLTVIVGRGQVLNCLSEVMEEIGRYKFLFSWRYARGIVTTDDAYFKRYLTKAVDKLVLNPVLETDAGTYRCDVQDASYKMVKRAYFGLKVLPPAMVHLEYAKALSSLQWQDVKKVGGTSPPAVSTEKTTATPTLKDVKMKIGIYSLAGASGAAVLIFLALCLIYREPKAKPDPY